MLNKDLSELGAIIDSATGLETGKAKWEIDYAKSEILSVIDHAEFDGFAFDVDSATWVDRWADGFTEGE